MCVCVCVCTCNTVADAVVIRLKDFLVFVRSVHDPCRGTLDHTVGVVLRLYFHLTVTAHTHTHVQMFSSMKSCINTHTHTHVVVTAVGRSDLVSWVLLVLCGLVESEELDSE